VTNVHPAVTCVLLEHFVKYTFLLLLGNILLPTLQKDSGYETRLCQNKSLDGIGDMKPMFSYDFFSGLFGKIKFLSFFKNLVKALTLKILLSVSPKIDLLFFFESKEK